MDCCPHAVPLRSRRSLLGSLGLSALALAGSAFAGRMARAEDHHTMGDTGMEPPATPPTASPAAPGGGLYEEAVASVYPESGFRSRIALGSAVPDLVASEVIVREKFESLYAARGGLPAGLEDVLDGPSQAPIHLTRGNAQTYVNLLWPLGLANRLAANAESPIRGDRLFSYASTGGWQLGREENGGAYFDRFAIVPLTPEQEALALSLAQSIFRPCCNNSTFFQDCNHGSAMFGLLQLGAAQGLTEAELYAEALGFNAFWFPDAYIKTAIYLRLIARLGWTEVEPRIIVGPKFSASRPWRRKVQAVMDEHPELIPAEQYRVTCGA